MGYERVDCSLLSSCQVPNQEFQTQPRHEKCERHVGPRLIFTSDSLQGLPKLWLLRTTMNLKV